MSEDTPRPETTAEDRLPGDPTKDELVERMIRVDHAGEYGAVRIYAGQRAVLRHGAAARARSTRWRKRSASTSPRFDRLVGERRVRPTALMPLWHVAGFALGAATAMMGARAAMACTAAIEDVIEEHYADQAAKLGDDEADLLETIETYRADELAHREAALAHDAEQAPGYEILSGAIKTGSRLAIWLSTRI